MTRVAQATAAVETFLMELGSHERVRWVITIRRHQKVEVDDAPLAECERQARTFGNIIGCCWVGNFDLVAQRCEIGYELGPVCWNQGFASELVPAITSFAFRSLGMNRIEAYVDSRNDASRHVLEKCGFLLEGLLRERDFYHGEFHDANLFALLSGAAVGN